MADRARDDDAPITGINVTPLVDVTLVLLVVFMVTTRAIVTQAMPFHVPQVKGPTEAPANVLSVMVDASGVVSVDGRVLDGPALIEVARAAHARDATTRAVIHASPQASHGAVVGVMDALRIAKVGPIAFGVERKP